MTLTEGSRPLGKRLSIALLTLGLFGCGKGKPNLSDDQLRYVETTVEVLRIKGAADTSVKDDVVKAKIANMLIAHNFTDSTYIDYSKFLAKDPAAAQRVFEAIKDSFPTPNP